jgi:hypothetical protein
MTCILLSRAIGGVFVDVVLREEHAAEMEIAEHPVERGAKISDHAWRKPYSVTLESVIDETRAMSSYEALLGVQKTAEPFDLMTGLKVYENMLVKRLTPTRDLDHARVLYFTADLQEVIIVSTQSGATLDGGGAISDATLNGNASSSDTAKSVINRGQVQARTVAPTTTAQTSLLETLATQ